MSTALQVRSSAQIFNSALIYFSVVFGAGFGLGIVRVLWSVPRFGERNAELLEQPVMLIAIILAARWTVRRTRTAMMPIESLAIGLMALTLLVVAELLVALNLRGLSTSEYMRTRDPVSGGVYLLMLGLFALMPWVIWQARWRSRRRSECLRVEDMPVAEMHALLQTASFGHLGCAQNGRPYVVPMHFAYDGKELYFFTTEGMKTQFMNGNPQVCLQVEEITDSSHWRSVMVIGRAERLTNRSEIERAAKQIVERNPSLTPAISATQLDAGGRPVEIAFYRIQPEVMDARKTV